jgi:hypothetical protein
MNTPASISGYAWLWVIGCGLTLFGVLQALGYVLRLLPLRSRSRALLERFGPLVSLVVLFGYFVLSLVELFALHARFVPFVLAAFVAVCATALWGPIRDLLTGVFLRAGGVLQVGDELSVDALHGRVERLFARRALIRTKSGEALVPYSHLSRSTLVRTRGQQGLVAHTFRVRSVAGLSQPKLRSHIVESALLCHWSAPCRAPELGSADNGAVDVTVFVLAKDMACEVEAAVRTQLAALEQSQVDAVLTHAGPVALSFDVTEERKLKRQ